jgi:hypothetical protein
MKRKLSSGKQVVSDIITTALVRHESIIAVYIHFIIIIFTRLRNANEQSQGSIHRKIQYVTPLGDGTR